MKVTLSIDSGQSIEIAHSDLALIIGCLNDDRRYGVFCAPLFDHPDGEVRSAVAGKRFLPFDELECLSRDSSIEVVQQVASNRRALKMFEAPLWLKMISRDVSVAAEIAGNLARIRESARGDVIDALLHHADPRVSEISKNFVVEGEEDAWEDDPVVGDDPE